MPTWHNTKQALPSRQGQLWVQSGTASALRADFRKDIPEFFAKELVESRRHFTKK